MIAKRLVELHGGELSVNSIAEQETMISIALPL
jgi:signal transduction histidine kinase